MVGDESIIGACGRPSVVRWELLFREGDYFDPDQRAFYYVRVLEIPKPSWLAYDAKFYDLDMPDEIPMTVQDRAYASPIWYTP